MKIAAVQINPIIGEFSHNFQAIKKYALRARDLSCNLVVFPELAISGYPPRDLLEKEDFIRANLLCLEQLIEEIHGIGVICGYVDRNQAEGAKPLFNSAVLFEDGAILAQAHKRLLPTYDVFDESRYFQPGKACKSIPYKGMRMGLTICEDAWNDKDAIKKRIYDLDPVAEIVKDGANLIVNISASPFYMGKREFRLNMLSAIAKKYGVPLLHSNQSGGNDSLVFDGISAAFDPAGQLVARGADFKEDLIVFDTEHPSTDIHPIAESEIESLNKALVAGTRDYVAKCGFSKAVVGLSGGIDSALTACIAVMALGPEQVHMVFMPSRYTSKDNYEDTQALAKNLGVELSTIPIDEMFAAFLKHLSPTFETSEPGITEQNIQARIRGTILMGLSNQYGYLVLSTGNKSELAVGYCTLYGDMSGGLAVISDVPKTAVYDLARHINRTQEIIPNRIITKPPSAELKPDQLDQDELPPYDALDAILKGYVEEFKGVDELVDLGFERELVEDIIARINRNEYKRHQAPPGLKVTSKAFGYGRRYPIAQGYGKRLNRLT
jgi:NAD+ synthetase